GVGAGPDRAGEGDRGTAERAGQPRDADGGLAEGARRVERPFAGQAERRAAEPSFEADGLEDQGHAGFEASPRNRHEPPPPPPAAPARAGWRMSGPRWRATIVANRSRLWSRRAMSAGVAPFWGPYTADAPLGPQSGLSTSQATATATPSRRGSRPLASIRSSDPRAPPPGGSSRPSASSSRYPRAWPRPAPPSLLALP